MTTLNEDELASSEARVAELQKTLQARLAEFRKLPAADPQRTTALDELVEFATTIDHAERMADAAAARVQRDVLEGHRATVERLTNRLGFVPILVAATTAVLTFTDLVSAWWFALGLPLFGVGLTIVIKPIALSEPAILERRTSALVGVLAAALLGAALIPWGWTVATVVLIVLTCLLIAGTAGALISEGHVVGSGTAEGGV